MKNIIVIKLGGIAIENLNDAFIKQINAWHLENKKIIIVHGGGQVISNLLTKNNHSTIKIDGMRVTAKNDLPIICLLYTSPSPRDRQKSRMPSSA